MIALEPTNVCYDCINKTGGCCTNVKLIIHKSEISEFLKAKKMNKFSNSDSLEVFDNSGNLYVYSSSHKKCHFLTSNNTCSIYNSRPLICKLYPVVWKKGLIETTDIFIDILCPLSHSVPLMNLYNPVNEIENKKMMKKIGSLEFNQYDSDYVNITDKKRSSEGLTSLYDKFER